MSMIKFLSIQQGVLVLRSGISLETVLLYLIIGLVLIGIPVFLARKSGRDPMEMLFGSAAKPDRKKPGAGSGQEREGSPGNRIKTSEGSAAPGHIAGGGAKKAAGKAAPERNSTKQELLETISALMSAGRKHHFYVLAPGTVTHEGKTATLSVILVTQAEVLGFNCFGYGGRIRANAGSEDWLQTMGGQTKKLESPIEKNKAQEQLLKQVLADGGHPEVPVKVYGIFTSAGAQITGLKGTGCWRKSEMLEMLERGSFDRQGAVPEKEIGKLFEKKIRTV